MPTIRSYTDAHEFLHTRGKPVPRKKTANNTYLHRTDYNGVDFIHLRLHNTDVVTWSDDGLIVLNTGGWLTVTTKARINDVLPRPWCLSSVKGTWFLTKRTAYGEPPAPAYRYQDGIQMRRTPSGWDVVVDTAASESQAEKDDRHNSAMRKLIGTYLKDLPAVSDVACTLCYTAERIERPGIDRAIYVSVGDRMEDTQHLIDHMLDRVLPYGLYLQAVAEKGYVPHTHHGSDTLKRCLRQYLSNRLFVGATAPAHGRKPLPTGVPA